MTEPLDARALLMQDQRTDVDRNLTQRYLELLQLRQQLRVAQCGRAAIEPIPCRSAQSSG
jgi:hypothetical protein